jgi:hypothetical protein
MLWKAMGAALLAVAAVHAGAATLSGDTRQLHDWVVKERDHHGRPFAIVDKKDARLFVFDGAGHLKGSTTVLLGQALGDDIAPDVGEHAQEGFVPPRERTTPAGRFESNPGVNRQGEHIVWVDYDSAFAIHRLRANKAEHARKVRLASSDPLQHRVSYGCVVVPVNFYKDVVAHWLGRGRAVVYVLPDNGSAADFFSAL